MTQKNKTITIVVLFIIVLLFAGKQYHDKKMYEAHISGHLFNKLQKLTIAIQSSNYIYQEILDTGFITKNNVDLLISYKGSILMEPQQLRGMALEFRRIKATAVVLPKSPIASTANGINRFLREFYSETLTEGEDVLVELDDVLRKKIERLYYLTSLWINSVERNIEALSENVGLDTSEYAEVYGKHSVSKDFWISLINDLESDTQTFLMEHSLNDISELLGN